MTGRHRAPVKGGRHRAPAQEKSMPRWAPVVMVCALCAATAPFAALRTEPAPAPAPVLSSQLAPVVPSLEEHPAPINMEQLAVLSRPEAEMTVVPHAKPKPKVIKGDGDGDEQ